MGAGAGRPAVNTFSWEADALIPARRHVGRILEAIADAYPVRGDAEITAECNPTT